MVTLFFVPYILFGKFYSFLSYARPPLTSSEVFWVTAVKKYGPNYVITFALFGWCSATIGTGFVQNYGQALACRMILGAFEAGVAPCFGFIFSTIYARESTAKRIALINLANVTSGAFGGLFAWGIQQMGTRRGLEAWRWLFIIEGSVSLAICGGLLWTFPNKPETAWFLNEDDKALMRLRKQRDAFFKGTDEFEWKWVKAALTDPFIYVASIAFFTSSVAIFGFGTFLPTILKGTNTLSQLDLIEKLTKLNRHGLQLPPIKLPNHPRLRHRRPRPRNPSILLRPPPTTRPLPPPLRHPRNNRLPNLRRHIQQNSRLHRHVHPRLWRLLRILPHDYLGRYEPRPRL